MTFFRKQILCQWFEANVCSLRVFWPAIDYEYDLSWRCDKNCKPEVSMVQLLSWARQLKKAFGWHQPLQKKKVLTKWTTIQASNNQFISLWVCHCHFLWPFKIKAILNYLKENSKNVIIWNDLSMPDLGARRFLHPLPWILTFWDNNHFKCDITFVISNY